jgi:hypothetical protein
LLQKEDIKNKNKILELELAWKENEEKKSRSKAKIECTLGWKAKLIILLLVDSGGFVVWTKHNHSDRDLENNELEMMRITSPVHQKTNFNVYPGNCQQDLM